MIDERDGRPIPEGKGETVRFSLDRTDHEIDPAEKNAKALRDALGKYVTAACRSGGGSRYDPKAVRASSSPAR